MCLYLKTSYAKLLKTLSLYFVFTIIHNKTSFISLNLQKRQEFLLSPTADFDATLMSSNSQFIWIMSWRMLDKIQLNDCGVLLFQLLIQKDLFGVSMVSTSGFLFIQYITIASVFVVIHLLFSAKLGFDSLLNHRRGVSLGISL